MNKCFDGPATAEHVARSFTRARTERVVELLDTLVSLGQCRVLEDGAMWRRGEATFSGTRS